MDRIELVKAIPLFESLDDDDLRALAHKLREVRVDAGERVFRAGRSGRRDVRDRERRRSTSSPDRASSR